MRTNRVVDHTKTFAIPGGQRVAKIYDRMDQPTFFEMFEVYRSARFKTNLQFKEERDARFKVMGGITNRSYDKQVRDREKNARAISEFLYNSEMKKK